MMSDEKNILGKIIPLLIFLLLIPFSIVYLMFYCFIQFIRKGVRK